MGARKRERRKIIAQRPTSAQGERPRQYQSAPVETPHHRTGTRDMKHHSSARAYLDHGPRRCPLLSLVVLISHTFYPVQRGRGWEAHNIHRCRRRRRHWPVVLMKRAAPIPRAGIARGSLFLSPKPCGAMTTGRPGRVRWYSMARDRDGGEADGDGFEIDWRGSALEMAPAALACGRRSMRAAIRRLIAPRCARNMFNSVNSACDFLMTGMRSGGVVVGPGLGWQRTPELVYRQCRYTG
jgi:hypothetical protein